MKNLQEITSVQLTLYFWTTEVCVSVCVCDLENASIAFFVDKKEDGVESLGKICLCVFVGAFVAFVDPWHDKRDLVDWLSSLALDAGSDHSSYL